jgi:hypothetical protein
LKTSEKRPRDEDENDIILLKIQDKEKDAEISRLQREQMKNQEEIRGIKYLAAAEMSKVKKEI